MERSGIRRLCTHVCKGTCCQGCYNSRKACHINEGRRLSCSLYLCHDIYSRIWHNNCRHGEEYYKIKDAILEALKSAVRANGLRSNIYFTVHTPEIQRKFKVLSSKVDFRKVPIVKEVIEGVKTVVVKKITYKWKIMRDFRRMLNSKNYKLSKGQEKVYKKELEERMEQLNVISKEYDIDPKIFEGESEENVKRNIISQANF